VTDLVILVVSVAIVDSLNPTTIVPALYLTTVPHAVKAILGFAAGFFVVNTAAGIVGLVVGRRVADLVPHPRPEVVHWAELVAGLGGLVAAALLWRRRSGVGAGFARVDGGTRRFAPLAGATIAAIELPTAVPYVLVIAAIAGSSHGAVVQISLLLVFNVLFLTPVFVIAIIRAFAGERAVEVLARFRVLLLRYAGAVMAGVALVLGLVLVTLGVVGLTGSS
jgi:cytochrome c biogenesis protein CcdA